MASLHGRCDIGSKNTTSTATQTLPSYLNNAYQGLVGSASQTASTPYTPYTGGFTQDQQQAFSNIRDMYGSSQPAFNASSNAYGQSLTPTSQTVNQYMSPYMDSVIQGAMANMQEQNAQQQQQVVSDAISKGAMGGNRVGVAQAELARQQKLADNASLANLYQSGYGTALGAAQADKAAALQAAQGYAGLGQTQMQTGLAQTAAQLGAGTQQQQFDYQQYLNQLAYPYQQQSWLGSMLSGLGSTAGGTTTQKTPQGNIFSQLLGAGLGVASLFKDGGAVKPHLAMGGVPYTNDNQEWPSVGAMMGASPYANDNANFGGYVPQVSFGGGGGRFPTIASPSDEPDYLSKYSDTMKEGAGNIKSWLTPQTTGADYGFGKPVKNGGVVGRNGYALGGVPVIDPYGYGALGIQPGIRREELVAVPDEVVPKIEALDAPVPAVGLSNIGGFGQGSNAPRSVRNNNPGNLEASDWTQKQPGYTGTDGRFAIFETPEAGRNAQLGLLGNYANRGFNTISSIVNRWAPPSDNNPTGSYVDYVARRTGIPANAELTPDQQKAVADAMSEFEGGNVSRSALGRATPNVPGGSAPGTVPYAQGEQFTTSPSNPAYSQNAQEAMKSFFAGKGLNVAPDVRNSLLTAGLGMMASRSPFALQGIGEGGLAGVKAWQDYQNMERENALARAGIGQKGEELAQKAIELGANVGLTNATTAQVDTTTQAGKFDYRYTPFGVQVTDKTTGQPGMIYPYYSMMPSGEIAKPPEGQEAPLFSTDAPVSAPDPRLLTEQGAGQAIKQATDAIGTAQADQASAVQTQQLLQEMKHNLAQLPESGLMAPGTAFPERASLAKGVNSYLSVFGMEPVFPEGEVAASEDLNKLTTRLGFDLSRILGSGEAASVIMNSIAAVPGGANSRDGAAKIIAGLEAGNKRRVDYYNFIQNWASKNGGSILGADEYFNRQNPPELYAISSYVPTQAMEYLRANPSFADAFNEKYGDGKDVARFVLGR